MNPTVLVVDGDPRVRKLAGATLGERGFRVLAVPTAEDAEAPLASERIDVVIAALRLPGRDGLDLLARMRHAASPVPVVLTTAPLDAPRAVEALLHGAADYLLTPFADDELESTVRGVLARARPAVRPARALVAESPRMKRVMALLDEVAEAPTTVLVTGGPGVDKERVARALHERSPRRERPFLALDCADHPDLALALFGSERGVHAGPYKDRPGLVEQADGGMVFLDSIADAPADVQDGLMHLFQRRATLRAGSDTPREVDVRVVATTDRNLAVPVREGTFRRDLYYRIAVFPVAVPPLRERDKDLEPLARALLDEVGRRLGSMPTLGERGLARLRAHAWPGDERELAHVLLGAALDEGSGLIEEVELPDPGGTSGAHGAIALAERSALERALRRSSGDVARAARLVGLDAGALGRRLDALGMR